MSVGVRRSVGRTGLRFERDFLGLASSDIDPKQVQTWESEFRRRLALIRKCNGLESLSYGVVVEQGVIFVRGIQSSLHWNPNQPRTDLATSFFQEVKSYLDRPVALRLFSSIGTPLDHRGVDFWLEYHGRILTFDLTTRSYKHGKDLQADLYLSCWDFKKQQQYLRVAKRVAERLSRVG